MQNVGMNCVGILWAIGRLRLFKLFYFFVFSSFSTVLAVFLGRHFFGSVYLISLRDIILVPANRAFKGK